MWADMCTVSAGDTGRRLFGFLHKFDMHHCIGRRCNPQFVIGVEEGRNIQSDRTAVAAVPASGTGDRIFHAFSNIK